MGVAVGELVGYTIETHNKRSLAKVREHARRDIAALYASRSRFT